MFETLVSVEQMFKDYRAPSSFTEEHVAWAAVLLAKREGRLAEWSRQKYLDVLEDLYVRLRHGDHQTARAMLHGAAKAELPMLDTFVVNCSALAIVQGLLQTPEERQTSGPLSSSQPSDSGQESLTFPEGP
jgi:hypothetical protein